MELKRYKLPLKAKEYFLNKWDESGKYIYTGLKYAWSCEGDYANYIGFINSFTETQANFTHAIYEFFPHRTTSIIQLSQVTTKQASKTTIKDLLLLGWDKEDNDFELSKGRQIRFIQIVGTIRE